MTREELRRAAIRDRDYLYTLIYGDETDDLKWKQPEMEKVADTLHAAVAYLAEPGDSE